MRAIAFLGYLKRTLVGAAGYTWGDDPPVGSVPVARLAVPTGPRQCVHAPRDGRSLTGDIRLLEAFHSEALANSRDVQVYLPPGYEAEPDRRFPVLYLHDGQNVFDTSTSFAGSEWGVDETAERLIHEGRVAPLIIVAINHAGSERADEFAPTRDVHRQAGGHASRYARFVVEELKPYVDSTFRTLTDARQTAIGGSSLGGLVTLHIGLEHPDLFGALAVLSPSIWWDRRAVLDRVERLPDRLPWRIWLDVGTAEGRDTVRNTRALRGVLLEKGWVAGRDLHYLEATDAPHSESAWADRVGPMLEFLFPVTP
jgi:predicted alpha/beta superfamily hydrolase